MKLLIVLLWVLLISHPTTQTPVTDAEDLIEGILVGAFGSVGHDVKGCIKDGEQVFFNIKDAIGYFENGGRDNIIQGIIKIGEAIALIPNEVKEWGAISTLVEDLIEIAAEFTNPEALIVIIGERILWRGIPIAEDIYGAVNNFRKGNFFNAGESIGDIIKQIFLMKPQDKIEDGIQFLKGFFKGAFEDEATDINTCVQDTDDLIIAFEKLVEAFKAGFDDIEKIVLSLLDVVSAIPKTVVQCQLAESKIQTLEAWIVQLQDFSAMKSKFFYAFFSYASRIKTDVANIISGFKDGKYNDSGFGIGDILHILFVDLKASMTKESSIIKEILQH